MSVAKEKMNVMLHVERVPTFMRNIGSPYLSTCSMSWRLICVVLFPSPPDALHRGSRNSLLPLSHQAGVECSPLFTPPPPWLPCTLAIPENIIPSFNSLMLPIVRVLVVIWHYPAWFTLNNYIENIKTIVCLHPNSKEMFCWQVLCVVLPSPQLISPFPLCLVLSFTLSLCCLLLPLWLLLIHMMIALPFHLLPPFPPTFISFSQATHGTIHMD